ncbi:MAG: SAM-dependent methyltransferase [Clostridia bacterium]|nr:SAM-dependent methyltransferase [Clostridia bacterium]
MLKISERLCTAASYVRDGAVVADIGTDHAYLPIYLALENKITRAIASDVNEGPISKARENISKYNLDNTIDTCIANGLDGINKYSPTDIVICGMGGELIVQILESSEYIKKQGIRLILQPMTMVKELREYLQNGYSAIAENVVFEDNKLYQIICVEYDGIIKQYSDIQLELGIKNIENGGDKLKMLLDALIKKKEKKLNGFKLGGYDTTDIEKEIIELKKLY